MARPRIFSLGQNRIGGFGNDQRQFDESGARSLDRVRSETIDDERDQERRFYEGLHSQLEQSRLNYEQATAQAKAERIMRHEAIVSEALPKLYAINPSDPTARQQTQQVMRDYPEAFHGGEGVPNLKEELHQHLGMIQESEKQRAAPLIEERKQKYIDDRQDRREQSISDRQSKSLDAREESRQAAADARDAAALSRAKQAHTAASSKTDELQSRLDKNREFFRGEQDPVKKDLLDKSYEQLQRQHDAADMAKTVLETVHPEVLAADAPSATPTASPVTASTPSAPPSLDAPETTDAIGPVPESSMTPPTVIPPRASAIPAPVPQDTPAEPPSTATIRTAAPPVPDVPAIPAPPSDAPAPTPAIGYIRGGHRFKGGDPSSRDSWEPVQ